MSDIDQIYHRIATDLGLKQARVEAVATLLGQGATIPFIARYRKEATGSLDELIITSIRDRLLQLQELAARRQTIFKTLEATGVLTPELHARIMAADNRAALEDLYLPYRPKRRTRATIAKEKGLEPLAHDLFAQKQNDPQKLAREYVGTHEEIGDTESALAGARDIMAEWIAENTENRALLRMLFASKAIITSKAAAGLDPQVSKYRDYFDWQEPIARIPSHRLLAMRRGEKEDQLNLAIRPPEEAALSRLTRQVVTSDEADGQQVKQALVDSYRRLLARSMETEIRVRSKESADKEAIQVFASNLRQLLLAPPLGAKRILAIDPGFRTGCKVVCLDRQGNLSWDGTVYPHTSELQRNRAASQLSQLCQKYKIEAVAVGNGTAGRETQDFLRSIELPGAPPHHNDR